MVTHILIGHVPIGTFSVGHDLPHYDSIAPHVTGGGEFAILYGFRRGPSDGDFAALSRKTLVSSWIKSRLNAFVHTGCSRLCPVRYRQPF